MLIWFISTHPLVSPQLVASTFITYVFVTLNKWLFLHCFLLLYIFLSSSNSAWHLYYLFKTEIEMWRKERKDPLIGEVILRRPICVSLPFIECAGPPGRVWGASHWSSLFILTEPHWGIPSSMLHKGGTGQKSNDLLKVATFRNLAGPGVLADFWTWTFLITSYSFLWEEGLTVGLKMKISNCSNIKGI